MKKIKKNRIMLISIVIALMISLVGCGKNPDKMIDEADELFDDEDYSNALEKYIEIIEVDPEYEDAYEGIIKSCIEMQDGIQMKEYLIKAKSNLSSRKFDRLQELVDEYNLKILDYIHTAIIVVYMDPELETLDSYRDDVNRWVAGCKLSSFTKEKDGLEKWALEIMGAENGNEVIQRLCILGNDNPSVKIILYEYDYFTGQGINAWVGVEGDRNLYITWE